MHSSNRFLFIGQLAYSEKAKSEGLSKAQWWVWDKPGGLAATGLSSHPHSVSDDRKTIALVGAVDFVDVTLYENTHKNRKAGAYFCGPWTSVYLSKGILVLA